MRLSRRQFGLAMVLLGASTGLACGQAPRDRGIGGTGVVQAPQHEDRGIGGTGVIGTVRRFGSIYVNDLRIAYAPGAEVIIDGARARASDMKIGHVVTTVAFGPDTSLTTTRIDIASEVLGPVEKVTSNGIIVLGQSVDVRGLRLPQNVRPGAFVAIFGHRRANGVIVANLIETRAPGRTKIAGPVAADGNGRLSIGGLALRGVPAGLAGSRVSVEGALRGGAYVVSNFRSLAQPFGQAVRRVSIEGYVAPGGLLGSGLRVSGSPVSGLVAGGASLAVITGRPGASGGVIADGMRSLEPRLQIPELGGPVPLRPAASEVGGGVNGNSTGPLRLPDGSGPFPGGVPLPGGQPGGLGPVSPGMGLPGGVGLPGNLRLPGR